MYLKKILTMIALVAAIGLTGSCNEENDPVEKKDPVLDIKPEVVEVPSEGGEFSVSYTIENPVEGAGIRTSCKENWISDINNVTEGKISFKVAPNEIEKVREAVVEVKYDGLDEVQSFTVKQAEYIAPIPFNIEIKDITNVAATVSIAPVDKKMHYLVRRKGANKMSQFENDEALFQDDMKSIQNAADDAEMSVKELLQEISYVDDQDGIELSVLKPGDDFVCYVYGIDIETSKRLTDIVRLDFTTIPVEMQDVEFELYSEVYIAKAQISFYTVDYDGYFYCSIYELTDEENLENRLMNLLTDEWMSTYAFFYGLNWDPADMMEDSAFKDEVVEVLDLEAETSYVMAAVALNADGLICSAKPAYHIFKTDKPKESDNEFTIDISEIGATRAYLKITPTNDDPYAAGILPYEYVKDLQSEEEIIDFLINSFMPNTFNGPFETDVRPLDPETEYYVFAFGYEAYTSTTSLTYKTFKTEKKSDEVSDVKGYVDYGDYGDSEAIGAIDEQYGEVTEPGTALVPMKTHSEPEGLKVFWNVFNQSDLEDPSITEELLVQSLTLAGFSTPSDIFQLPYGLTIVGVAVAEDEKGNAGKVFIGEPMTLTPEGAIPAADFIEKYPFPAQAYVPFRIESPKTVHCNTLMSERFMCSHSAEK